jgi:hypothetical protein
MVASLKTGNVLIKNGHVTTTCGCCDNCPEDGKPRTDPQNEGTWVPSGSWPTKTWTFNANPGNSSGETWFFYGNIGTSKKGGSATTAEIQDYGNLCNWYSNRTAAPSDVTGFPESLNKRATRLPPSNAVIHVFSPMSTASYGPATVKKAYFWNNSQLVSGSTLTGTEASAEGAIIFTNGINNGTLYGGVTFNCIASFPIRNANNSGGIVYGGAVFNSDAVNQGTVNGGATFQGDRAENNGFVVSPFGSAIVNDGATFNAGFNVFNVGTVNGGAVFNGDAVNQIGAIVNGGATFNDSSLNSGTVNSGAVFNDTSQNLTNGRVNGGATFNDDACSTRVRGSCFATPCSRRFVAHPTDLPTCAGNAPAACDNSCAATCGCG